MPESHKQPLAPRVLLPPEASELTRTPVEEFSRGLFGRKKRLEVMAFLASHYEDGSQFHSGEVAAATAIPLNEVWNEIGALDRMGLMEFTGAPHGGKPRYYRLRPSVFWPVFPAGLEERKRLAARDVRESAAARPADRRR